MKASKVAAHENCTLRKRNHSIQLRSVAITNQTYHRKGQSWTDRSVIGTIVITFVLCSIPGLLTLAGVDFGSRNGKGGITHTILEWSSVMISIITFFVTLLHFYIRSDLIMPLFGLALFGSGMMDMFHTLAAARILTNTRHDIDFIPFTWAISRLVNSTILLVSTSFIVYRYVFRKHMTVSRATALKIIPFVACILGCMLVATTIICTRIDLPQTQFPEQFISRPYDVIPLVIYIFVTIILGIHFHHSHSSFIFGLFVGEYVDVYVQMYMAFGSSALFDNGFNIAHFLKIMAYSHPLMGLILDLELGDVVEMMQTEIRESHNYVRRQLDLIGYSRPMIAKLSESVYQHWPLFVSTNHHKKTSNRNQVHSIDTDNEQMNDDSVTDITIHECVGNPVSLEYFKDFLVSNRKQYEPHICFWMNCAQFEQLINKHCMLQAESLFLMIVATYLDMTSPHYLELISQKTEYAFFGLQDTESEYVNSNEDNKSNHGSRNSFHLTTDLFMKAQHEVLQFLEKNAWQEFQEQESYRVCCRVLEQERQFQQRLADIRLGQFDDTSSNAHESDDDEEKEEDEEEEGEDEEGEEDIDWDSSNKRVSQVDSSQTARRHSIPFSSEA